jgi:type VI protein secretion system component Hcp
MTQPSDKKPTSAPKKPTTSNQPTLTELSPDQLEKVSGGQKVSTSDFTFTHVVDKSTP